MIFTWMRDILAEAFFQLESLFEQGLEGSQSREAALEELEKSLTGCGLDRGGQLAGELREALRQGRTAARWNPEQAARSYASLWRYCSLCQGRLEFLEAKASLEAVEE